MKVALTFPNKEKPMLHYFAALFCAHPIMFLLACATVVRMVLK